MDETKNTRPHLFIVDDVADNITLLTAYLKKEYSFLTALSGQSALGLLSNLPKVDCLLLDIAMPGMDGLELLRRIRSRPFYANTPAIAVTAQSSPDEVMAIRAAGFDAHIPKPVDFGLLNEAILLNIAPASENVVPASENTAPTVDNIAPASENIAPAIDNIVPAIDNIPPASGSITPISVQIAL